MLLVHGQAINSWKQSKETNHGHGATQRMEVNEKSGTELRPAIEKHLNTPHCGYNVIAPPKDPQNLSEP